MSHRPHHFEDVNGSIEILGREINNMLVALMVAAVAMIVLAAISYVVRDIRDQQYWKRKRESSLRKTEPDSNLK